jgi:hypothetical protein
MLVKAIVEAVLAVESVQRFFKIEEWEVFSEKYYRYSRKRGKSGRRNKITDTASYWLSKDSFGDG